MRPRIIIGVLLLVVIGLAGALVGTIYDRSRIFEELRVTAGQFGDLHARIDFLNGRYLYHEPVANGDPFVVLRHDGEVPVMQLPFQPAVFGPQDEFKQRTYADFYNKRMRYFVEHPDNPHDGSIEWLFKDPQEKTRSESVLDSPQPNQMP